MDGEHPPLFLYECWMVIFLSRSVGCCIYPGTATSKGVSILWHRQNYKLIAFARNYRSDLRIKKGGAQEVCPLVWKNLRTIQRERDHSATITRLSTDPTTAQSRRNKTGENRPSRPPIVVRETHQQRRHFGSAYRAGGTTFCDEMPC